MPSAFILPLDKAGRTIAARMAMMAIDDKKFDQRESSRGPAFRKSPLSPAWTTRRRQTGSAARFAPASGIEESGRRHTTSPAMSPRSGPGGVVSWAGFERTRTGRGVKIELANLVAPVLGGDEPVCPRFRGNSTRLFFEAVRAVQILIPEKPLSSSLRLGNRTPPYRVGPNFSQVSSAGLAVARSPSPSLPLPPAPPFPAEPCSPPSWRESPGAHEWADSKCPVLPPRRRVDHHHELWWLFGNSTLPPTDWAWR